MVPRWRWLWERSQGAAPLGHRRVSRTAEGQELDASRWALFLLWTKRQGHSMKKAWGGLRKVTKPGNKYSLTGR